MNNRRKLVLSLGAGAQPLSALAQSERRPRRIGYSGAGRAETDAPWLAAFREGMAALKWVDGRDYVLATRFGNSIPQALPALAAELIATQPEVIVAPGDGAVPPLLQVSRSIPIVFTLATDPVGLGFASSL